MPQNGPWSEERGKDTCMGRGSGQKMLRAMCQRNLKGTRPTVFNYGLKLGDNCLTKVNHAPKCLRVARPCNAGVVVH